MDALCHMASDSRISSLTVKHVIELYFVILQGDQICKIEYRWDLEIYI